MEWLSSRLVLICSLICLVSCRSFEYRDDNEETVTYNGAVLEYEPYIDWIDGGSSILHKNLEAYKEFALTAKEVVRYALLKILSLFKFGYFIISFI